MSIIEADIAVENLIYKVLKKYYEKAIVVEDKIKEMIINGILSKNINSLDNEIRLALPTLDKNVLGNWKANCHRKRNKVIHMNEEISEEEAKKALLSAKEIIELLKDFLYNEKDWILEATAFINDRKKAKCYLEKSIATKPHPDAYYYLGHIECEAKNYDIAIQHYKIGLELFNHPFFNFYMGKCYEDQGLYEDAIDQYNEAINGIEQSDKAKRKFLMRDPYNNPYYQKYLVIKEQKLEFKRTDMTNLFNSLLEVFPNITEFKTLRDTY